MKSIDTTLVSDIIQLVVVLICVILFLYVRLACGKQARYFVHLAFAYLGMGAIYAFDGFTEVWFYFTKSEKSNEIKAFLQMIKSSLSLLNTAFFITAWYLMRDLRLEQEEHPDNAEPTMSNPFAATVIGSLVVGIAAFIGMAHLMIQRSDLLILIYLGVDLTLAAISAVLVGCEFFCIKLLPQNEEGTIFNWKPSHLIFRVATFLLFLAFGLLQFGVFASFMTELKIFEFPTGAVFHVFAILRILCAGAAVILGLHALPSVRWKHKQLKRGKRSKPPNNSFNRSAN